jgi:hypothetical protein
MRQSALWSAFFFIGLFLACARFLDSPQLPASSGSAARAAVAVHHVKIAIRSHDTRITVPEAAIR